MNQELLRKPFLQMTPYCDGFISSVGATGGHRKWCPKRGRGQNEMLGETWLHR
jgi:hypothetical protein